MASIARDLFLASSLLALLVVAGCASPCNRYCDSAADYIEFCLENGTQDVWTAAAAGGGWSNWGASDRDQYATDCKEDMDAQLGSEDSDTLSGACEDDANQYTEWEERGACVDLP